MPKPYVRRMPALWWLRRQAYFYFMLRELTAVFIAAYCVILLVMLWRLKQAGPAAHDTFEDIVAEWQSPGWIVFHFVAFVAALYHAFTWFNLTPQIMVVRLGEEKVPGWLIALANYVLWAVVSGVLIYLVL